MILHYNEFTIFPTVSFANSQYHIKTAGEVRGLMGVRDFSAALVPGSKSSQYTGDGRHKILTSGTEKSPDIYEEQKVETSPNGGVLNQVPKSFFEICDLYIFKTCI